jgi:RNA polymerase sigma-70 factor (ECF subfamily)
VRGFQSAFALGRSRVLEGSLTFVSDPRCVRGTDQGGGTLTSTGKLSQRATTNPGDTAGDADPPALAEHGDPGEQIDLLMPYLQAMARKLTGNPHDASDLVQDALLRALRALPGLPAGTDLRPWLATIVRHLHVDRLRQLARDPLSIPLEEASASALTVEAEPGKDEPASGARVEHLEHLEQALTLLPEEFRQVFVLHALEGRSYRDIADSLGIPMATVGTRLSRARLKLRGLLGGRLGSSSEAEGGSSGGKPKQ